MVGIFIYTLKEGLSPSSCKFADHR